MLNIGLQFFADDLTLDFTINVDGADVTMYLVTNLLQDTFSEFYDHQSADPSVFSGEYSISSDGYVIWTATNDYLYYEDGTKVSGSDELSGTTNYYTTATGGARPSLYETEYAVKSTGLIATAEAIRAKTGGTGKIAWSDEKGFAEAVAGISGGGGGIAGGYTVTFMNGGTEYSVISVTAGQSIMAPTPNPSKSGEYFVGWYTAATGGSLVKFPYTPTADTTLYASFDELIVLGFTGLTNSTGVLTLTDDVSGFGSFTTSTDDMYVNVSNPLDSVFPYDQITEFEDASGNVFVKFPKFYMKWVTDSNGVIDGWKISNAQVDDSYFIPDCFLSPSGGVNDYFALGKYEMSGSSSKGYSKSGQTCYVNCTRANARSAARAYGTSSDYYNGYQQLDFAQLTAYNFLCMMYYGTANIQTVYGGRTSSVSSRSSASVTGTCDGVAGLNGWNTGTDCVKMLGIENPFGNVHKWVDGVYFSGTTIYAHRFPQYFAEGTSNAASLGFSRPTSSGYVSALKHGTTDATKSGVYASAASGSASTYYGDYSWYNSSGTVLCVGGRWNDTSVAGLWCLVGYYSASGSNSSIGARLSYRPL